MTRRWIPAAACLAAVGAVAGCGSATTPGSPQPVTSSSSAPSSQDTGATLTLNGVDPCSLITPSQQKQLNLGPGRPQGNSETLNTPDCAFQIGSGYSINITTDFSQGIDRWQGRLAKTSPAKFGEFDAVQIINPVLGCSFAVQTAPSQELVVDYLIPNDSGETSQQMCPDARKYTEAALATLKSSK